jgi:putative transposase
MHHSKISVDEHYHLCSRGVAKQNIFIDDRDYIRFLFLILYFQSPVNLFNLSRPVTSFVRSQTFNISPDIIEQIIKQRMIELNTFCLMPNHFHLIIREVEEGGTAKFMQRILTAYAKYFNTKYQRTGHVFENLYYAVHIEDNNQLLYVSAYVHKNPFDLKKNYENYPWSSFSDYSKTNKWGKFLNPEIILEQFDDEKDYAKWVRETSAKELEAEIEESLPELLEV